MAKIQENIIPKKLKQISVKGAKLHNLKNVDVNIPHNKLTVITGVSGSGKSTLAFDTIYAEGQRRFVESLSAYARQFLERMSKPDVEYISGLPPAIAIEQRSSQKNPRSTVGTSTEVYDYFRLLYGRIGITICKKCGKQIKKDSSDAVVEDILKFGEKDKIYITFPISTKAKSIEEELIKCRELGYFRLTLNSKIAKKDYEIIDFTETKLPDDIDTTDVMILVDRFAIEKDQESITRITDSIETAFNAGEGKIQIVNLKSGKIYKYSKKYECADCEIQYVEPEPRLFSFNNPFGACPHCQGFGNTIGLSDDLIFPDKTKSIRKGVINPFTTPGHAVHLRDLLQIAPKYKIPIDAPLLSLTDAQMQIIMDGADEYIGINNFFIGLEEKNYKMHNRVMLSRYRGYTECKHCQGSRLRTSARQVFVDGKNIPELIKMPLSALLDFANNLKLSEHQIEIAEQVINEIKWRLGLLVEIGVEYLTLDRMTHTLSGGESQRINLSSALGSSLVGTLYVLDEPSIGMHPRDTKRLLEILFKLRNLGNTIIVVEHDPDIMEQADMIVDMGPKAGEHGGKVIFAGTYQEILKSKTSLTGQYLSGKKKIEIPDKRILTNGNKITLYNPKKHNLKISKLDIPLGCMVAVTGVSGSGKSTLIHDVLYAHLQKYHGISQGPSSLFDKIEGADYIESVELVDQTPIGRSSRSTPVTYTKVFELIRETFANTQASRQLGWRAGHFSFNIPGGRCDVCEGEGTVTVEMQFLPDVHLECEGCKGTRYKRETRQILYKNKSIVDVLNMTINEALEFFEDDKKIVKKLSLLREVGLGYLKLGQPSSMLSGGESQRIKLAAHLESNANIHKLFIFDEPTTGLHLDDISKLLTCFKKLIDSGNSIIVIEHNIHVIASADWIIDLGPEGGEGGGEIVATGTPERVAQNKKSYTGEALKKYIK